MPLLDGVGNHRRRTYDAFRYRRDEEVAHLSRGGYAFADERRQCRHAIPRRVVAVFQRDSAFRHLGKGERHALLVLADVERLGFDDGSSCRKHGKEMLLAVGKFLGSGFYAVAQAVDICRDVAVDSDVDNLRSEWLERDCGTACEQCFARCGIEDFNSHCRFDCFR